MVEEIRNVQIKLIGSSASTQPTEDGTPTVRGEARITQMDKDAMISEQRDLLAKDHDTFAAEIREGETVAVSRKKVLLRLLAGREAERLGIVISARQIRETTEAFRRQFGLLAEADFKCWLVEAGFDGPAFEKFVREIALVEMIEAHFDDEILRELPSQRKAQTVYTWQSGERWVQFNVEQGREKGRASADAVRVFERIGPLVAPESRPASLRRFFMTRKPPGLRIRVAGPKVDLLTGPFEEILDELRREGAVVGWFIVPYEPERFRFGNQRLLDITHEWFEADSLAWLRWEPLELRHGNKISREVLSLAILDDLFFNVLRDEAEVWDVWCRVALEHDLPLDTPARPVPAIVIANVKQLANPVEREILDSYERANRTFGKGIETAARQGELVVGPRQLLATLTLFHWNRYGLSLEARRRIIGPLLRGLDPQRSMSGGGGNEDV